MTSLASLQSVLSHLGTRAPSELCDRCGFVRRICECPSSSAAAFSHLLSGTVPAAPTLPGGVSPCTSTNPTVERAGGLASARSKARDDLSDQYSNSLSHGS